jgi:glucose-6-phosphate 1-dehydrogenase
MGNNSLTSIVIFGASGDLTKRKLIPSLFNLCRKDRIPHPYIIVGSGGTAFTDEQFRQHLEAGTKEFASFKFSEQEWADFSSTSAQANYTGRGF